MSTILPDEWSWPQLLLWGLALAVLVGIVIALSTSTAAFGAYNPGWDGASGLSDLADDADTDTRIALNTTVYARATPNRTIAVILSPDDPYGETDRARLRAFVADGGTLVVAEDVGPVGNTLLAAVGAETRFDGRPVRDERHHYRSPAFPTATNVSDAPETEGVEQVTLNHGTTLRTDASDNDTRVLVRTSGFAYLDANRNEQLDDAESLAPRPVVVSERIGNGTVIAISDPSLFINAMLDRPGNRRLVRNLFGTHERAVLDYSGHGEQPPLSVALLALRGSLPLQAVLGALGIGTVLVWSRRPEQLRRPVVWLRKRRANGPAGERDDGLVDVDTLAAYLRREHPDWDERRVRRVITGVLARRRERGDDDRSG